MGKVQGLLAKRKKALINFGLALTVLVAGWIAWKLLYKRFGDGMPIPSGRVRTVKAAVAYKLEKDAKYSSLHGFQTFTDNPNVNFEIFKDECPVDFVSDIGFTMARKEPEATEGSQPSSEKCLEKQIVFVTAPMRIGLTLEALNSRELFDWFTKNQEFKKFSETEVGEGLFLALANLFRIRGEDLQLPKFVGPILLNVMENVLGADARLDWIPGKGNSGIVFSFDSRKSKTATQLVFSISEYLGNKIYLIDGLNSAVVEAYLGTQRLAMTKDAERIYVGTNVNGLIGAIEDRPKNQKEIKGSALLTVNAAAFLDGRNEFSASVDQWQAQFAFNLNATLTEPSSAVMHGTNLIDLVQGSLDQKVLRAIPYDVMSAFAVAHQMPDKLQEFQWSKVIKNQNIGSRQTAGTSAIIWDFDRNANHLSAVGLALSVSSPGDLKYFANVWKDSSLLTTCAEGRVVVMATVASLLGRMKEACNRSSLSVADWQSQSIISTNAQSLIMANPEIFGRELFIYGMRLSVAQLERAKHANNQMSPQISQQSMDELLAFANRVVPGFAMLPAIGYSGNAVGKSKLEMTGFKKARR